ncbi:hypothetical protein ACE6H2_000652 [Prunus campanulata]
MEYFQCFVFSLQGYGISRQGELQHKEKHLAIFSMSRLWKTMPIKQYITTNTMIDASKPDKKMAFYSKRNAEEKKTMEDH